MQITWLSYFGSENQGLPLRSWFMTCWLWRHIPIVTSLAVPSSCVVTQMPMGMNSGTRCRKRKFPLLFVICDRGRIEIDHSLCRLQAAAQRPAQLVLFRIAVPTTPALTLSWSIPIAMVQIMAWRRPGGKPLSEAMMVSLLMHICITRPQWVNYEATMCAESHERYLWTHWWSPGSIGDPVTKLLPAIYCDWITGEIVRDLEQEILGLFYGT